MLNAMNHPCLQKLLFIFLRTMQGIYQLVDGFLGIQNRPELKSFQKGDISITSGSSLPPSTPLSASPPPQRMGKHSNQSLSRRSSNLHFPEPPKSIGVAIDPPDNKRSSKVRYQHYFFFMKMWSNSLIFW